MRRWRHVLLCAGVLGGCGPAERGVTIFGVPEDLEVTLRAGDEVLVHHRVRDRITARSTASIHTLTTHGPCGDVEVPLATIETYGAARLEYQAGAIPRRRILLDTRDAPRSATVAIGALSLDVPVGVTRVVELVAPTCPEGREVRLSGERVGTLPEDDDAEVLLDVRGSHCYRVDRADRESIVLLTLDATSPDRALDHLAPATLRTLSARIDFPFEAVPSRVDLDALPRRESADGHYAITSLVPIACAPAARDHSPK